MVDGKIDNTPSGNGDRPDDDVRLLDPAAGHAVLIHNLIASYFQRVDRPSTQSPADLFADDATLVLGNLRCAGRTEILRFFEDRVRTNAEAGRTTRHVTGGIELTSIDARRFSGRSTALVFAGWGALPITAGSPSTICDFDDVYRWTFRGWVFESRIATVVFVGEAAASFTR